MDGTPFGRYRLIELLGRGGMGEVWRAHDTTIDRTVAIKMLLPHFAQDERFEQRFRREARAAARLDDPHVVPIYDVGEVDGRLYVAMRLINGQDLQALLEAGPLEPQRTVAIIDQIAQALHAAHEVGLVHRDVKPSNILVTDRDFAYLIDFGIARAAGETGLTSTGATIGTWSYMAPERFSTGYAGAGSDIYALACVLYECLTGELPFPAVALEQIMAAHMTTPPPQPSTQRSAIPAAMDGVIATGMAKEPDQRYATTVELASAAHDAVTSPSPRTAQNLRTPSAFVTSPVPATEPATRQRAADLDVAATQKRPPPASPRPRPVGPPDLDDRKRWQLLQVVVVVVAALVVVGIIVGIKHSYKPAATVTTTTTTISTSTTPLARATAPPVAEASLEGLLLSAGQINSVMGTTSLTDGGDPPIAAMLGHGNVSDDACVPLFSPAQAAAYAGSGWTAMRGQSATEPNSNTKNYAVGQDVVSFPSAHDAEAFFTASAQSWAACANRQFTQSWAGQPTSVYNVGPVSNTNGTLSITRTGDDGKTCQRALTAANNVVIDVNACSHRQSGQAVYIARQIAAKVPTT